MTELATTSDPSLDAALDEFREVVGSEHVLAGKITSVPGGVGPMTIAMLLADTLTAAKIQQGRPD